MKLSLDETPLIKILSSQMYGAIERICFAPIILPDREDPKPDQQSFLTLVRREWTIKMFWVAYYQVPNINIRKQPFSTPDFRNLKTDGKNLAYQLRLCQGVFDSSPIPGYSTPLEWWEAQMMESQKCDLLYGLDEKGRLSKTEGIKAWREQLSVLRGKNIPVKDLAPKRHNLYQLFERNHLAEKARLLRKSVKLANPKIKKGRHFISQYWQPYLDTCQEIIENLNNNPKSRLVWYDGERVMLTGTRGQGSKPVPLLSKR